MAFSINVLSSSKEVQALYFPLFCLTAGESSSKGVAGMCPAEGAADRTAAKRGPGSAGETYPAKIIISAEFTLRPGFDIKKSEECMNFRREKGHFKAPSAGSAFKNDAEHGIIAGKIIDECGLKGLKCGGAQIAPWHGNFIINPEQKARAQDIKNLSDLVKKTVFEKKAVSLENEILFIGFQ
ncbi:MAG: hypothetical protein J6Y93_05895, partial [Treponema sp.]|nr:hypothetical protein [Treponema sp.]